MMSRVFKEVELSACKTAHFIGYLNHGPRLLTAYLTTDIFRIPSIARYFN